MNHTRGYKTTDSVEARAAKRLHSALWADGWMAFVYIKPPPCCSTDNKQTPSSLLGTQETHASVPVFYCSLYLHHATISPLWRRPFLNTAALLLLLLPLLTAGDWIEWFCRSPNSLSAVEAYRCRDGRGMQGNAVVLWSIRDVFMAACYDRAGADLFIVLQ